MTKSTSVNYTAAGTAFPIATDAGDDLAKEDLFTLQKGVEEHTHDSTRGLAVRRVNTSSAPAATGQVQINNDDLRWWAAIAGAIRTAANLEGAQTWTGQQRFNQPILVPHQGSTPAAPGAGLAVIYVGTDGLVYKRSGTGNASPVGALPGLVFKAETLRTLGTPGTWAELRQVALGDAGAFLEWVQTFDGTATEKVEMSFPVPPSYTGTPINILVTWKTAATSGNVAFRMSGLVTGTGGDMTAAFGTLANLATFAAQGTANRKNLSTLPWTATLPAANDWIQCSFSRVAADGSDTINAVDVDVLSVTVAF